MSKLQSKGFSLIELLVVISIIALLSSVAFASFKTVRSKSRDSKAIASLRSIFNQVEVSGFDSSVYTNICTDPKIVTILASLSANNIKSRCHVINSPTYVNAQWAVSIDIDGNYFSVSQKGISVWDKSYVPDTAQGHNAAIAFCKDKGARLPEWAELYTLRHVIGISNPTDFSESLYQSDLISLNGANIALMNMSVGSGAVSNGGIAGSYYVRCVR